MAGFVRRTPLLVLLMGIGALAMLVPASYAAAAELFDEMRAFLYSAVIFLILTAFLAIATPDRKPKNQGFAYLLALVITFLGLPLMLAVPVQISVPDTRFINAYVEMVSALTTTGATLFDDPARLSPAVHLWRAQCAWMGGFFILVAAGAILAPMHLGGFDVLSSNVSSPRSPSSKEEMWAADGSTRLTRLSLRLFPIYGGLTFALWLILMMLHKAPLVNLIHAMSILSTSGITSLDGGLTATSAGVTGEVVVFAFMLLALTRQPFTSVARGQMIERLRTDPELRLGAAFVIVLPTLLFIRHWVGAIEVNEAGGGTEAFEALWGGVFTVLSFLSTTGFESQSWNVAQDWSGLDTPGMILLGLALIGGGVATTAGGVKLLRVYALYIHGKREVDRLVHPSSIGGSGATVRRLRREGAFLAWVFFMLFALAMAVVVMAFSIAGLDLDTAMTLAIAGLSTTGPVAQVTLSDPISYGALSDASKYILTGAMVLGRLEMLVIIALFNPDFWRR